MADISVIGLGNMGAALAGTLLDAGHRVCVWNRSPGKAAGLAARGADVAASVAEAITASPISITCLKNHKTVTALLDPVGAELSGRTVVDLSTGGAGEARDLVRLLTQAGAGWQIGMINAYPSGVGKADSVILCAGPEAAWAQAGDYIRTLGGASAHVGTTPEAIPALFAAMFTARQGFMFGLIYGGAVCKKAGLPVEVFADRLPVTMDMLRSYAETFTRTVPPGAYDDAEATLEVYANSLEDVLSTFRETGAADGLPHLMHQLTQRGLHSGLGAKELTVLVEALASGQVEG